MATADHTRMTSDGPMRIYEATPDGAAKGALIVVMEAFGVNDHIEEVTRRAAAAGYHAVAPDFFHRAGGQAVARHIDHIVGARHDVEIAILIDISGVAGFIIAGEVIEVGFAKTRFGIPERGQGAGGQRQLDRNGPQCAGGNPMTAFVKNPDIIARHRH